MDADAVRYYVDGASGRDATASRSTQEMRPVVSDYSLFGAGVKVDWLRMSNYPTTGTFTSRVARQRARRERLADARRARAAAPPARAIAFQTRSGDTRQPDASWSAWQPVGAGGAIASPNARYLQYRATLTRQRRT